MIHGTTPPVILKIGGSLAEGTYLRAWLKLAADHCDHSIVIVPGGGLAPTRGRVYDHWAVSTANLDTTVTRLKSEGVKFLEEIHPWGSMRAAMIEVPDRIAIEIVEVK